MFFSGEELKNIHVINERHIASVICGSFRCAGIRLANWLTVSANVELESSPPPPPPPLLRGSIQQRAFVMELLGKISSVLVKNNRNVICAPQQLEPTE